MRLFGYNIPFLSEDPPNTITYSDAGRCGLPVEIWQEIFTATSALLVTPAHIEDEVPRSDNVPVFIYDEHFIDTDSRHFQRAELFQMRLSLVLVCKSWYFMAIEFLYQHLRIDMYMRPSSLENLQRVLERDASLAQKVERLSVEDDYSKHKVWIKKKNDRFKSNTACVSIMELLPNIKMLVCPWGFAFNLPSTIIVTPSVCVFRDNNSRWGPGKRDRLDDPSRYWQKCHTLSLKADVGGGWLQRGLISLAPPTVRFNRLVNLRLQLEVDAQRWVAQDWELPSLKSLSLYWWWSHDRFLPLLLKVASTLENLEIPQPNPFGRYGYKNHPAILLPRLHTLCLLSSNSLDKGLEISRDFLRCMNAPRLRRFSLHVHRFTDYLPSTVFRQSLDLVLEQYSTITEIELFSETKRDDLLGATTGHPILEKEYIRSLYCRGIEFESGCIGGRRQWYREEDPPPQMS